MGINYSVPTFHCLFDKKHLKGNETLREPNDENRTLEVSPRKAQPQKHPKAITPSEAAPPDVPTHKLPKRDNIDGLPYNPKPRVKDIYEPPYHTKHNDRYQGEESVEISLPWGVQPDGTVIRAGEYPFLQTEDIFVHPMDIPIWEKPIWERENKRRSIDTVPERTVAHALEQAPSGTHQTRSLDYNDGPLDEFLKAFSGVAGAMGGIVIVVIIVFIIVIIAAFLCAVMRYLFCGIRGSLEVENDVELGETQDPEERQQQALPFRASNFSTSRFSDSARNQG